MTDDEKTLQAVLERLKVPLDPRFIEWKPMRVYGDDGQPGAFVDMRHYQNRLDAAWPAWSDHYEMLAPDGSLVKCGITICGVTREDVGEKTDEEVGSQGQNTFTSASAQAFKRACCKWGLGRSLYFLPEQWVPMDEKKKKFARTPTLPQWYYDLCGVPVPGGKQAVAAAAAKADQAVAAAPQAAAAAEPLTDADFDKKRVAVGGMAEQMKDPVFLKKWWASVREIGYDRESVHARLGVAHLEEAEGSVADVWLQLVTWCPGHAEVKTKKTNKDSGEVWYSHKLPNGKYCKGALPERDA